MITASFKSASIVESLHLSTSVVEDPVFVSSPIGRSVHLLMACLDLRMSISSVELDVYRLWMDSRDEVVIQ